MILFAALACSAVGLAWLALAMDVHWQQVRGPQSPARSAVTLLRVLGALALAASLVLCLVADHLSMAPLVWVMSLAGGALLVAFALAWKPRLLAPLVAWLPARGGPAD
ncbi:MAG TPA: DUF3325 family protein [Burkholderiales bacterium]|nr:DUF3325 family protein [Burkholderiales bacterium]